VYKKGPRLLKVIMAMESAAVDAQNQGPTILAVCWLLVIIPGLMVGLRIWCKVGLSKRGFGLDDAIICVAWVCVYEKFYAVDID
jgi:hypothetical protein